MLNVTRLKVQLKLSINRLKMLQTKKNALSQGNRHEIATLLGNGKEESARVRVEHIIRDDFQVDAMEKLEIFCDLLSARIGLIEQYKDCEESLKESVNSIIWAAPRLSEAKELSAVRELFVKKYGKEFVAAALEDTEGHVNERVKTCLQVNTPDPVLVEQYLEAIAKDNEVQWESGILKKNRPVLDESDSPSSGDEGGVRELAALSPPLPAESPSLQSEITALPEIPAVQPPKQPHVKEALPPVIPDIPTTSSLTNSSKNKPAQSDDDQYEQLKKRLEALKRK